MKKFTYFFFLLIFLVSSFAADISQGSESFLEQFQRNLMDSFIGHMRADGKEVTPRHRAMFMGYILDRQLQRIGTYAMDKRRMKGLIAEVKRFLESVSGGNDYWPVVEAGMRGEYQHEVNAMLGGSAYVTAIFPTLDDMVASWQKWDYNTNRFYKHPDNQAILNTAHKFLQMLRAQRYQEALTLAAGRCYEQFSEFISEAADSKEARDRLNRYFDKLEWKAGLAGMSDTDPPMVKIVFALRTPDGDWDEDPCIMILDDGIWKIARFID